MADQAPRPFCDWILEQRNGLTHAELTEAIATLCEAVMETDKPGELTLKIKVRKASKGARQLVVSDQVMLKAPSLAREESIFFFSETSSSLTRNDPVQPMLPLETLAPVQAAPLTVVPSVQSATLHQAV
jgi:hypothetical protein